MELRLALPQGTGQETDVVEFLLEDAVDDVLVFRNRHKVLEARVKSPCPSPFFFHREGV